MIYYAIECVQYNAAFRCLWSLRVLVIGDGTEGIFIYLFDIIYFL